ncbi:MAG: hypothetical protein LBG94_09515 [Treponema sp.]|jgi:rhamnose utilization protein RhaD (predicted bifunctional aldolase and dehydrogenase)|nr:hypothetical protein [Treponema sp.]
MEKIGAKIIRKPDFSDEQRICAEEIPSRHAEIFALLKELSGYSSFMNSKEIARYIKDRPSFYPVSSAFTPDHIVYAGSDPIFTEANTPETIRADWDKHTQKTGRAAKIIAVKSLGVFSAAATQKAAFFALDLFKDTVKVAVYTESFAGPLFMTQDKIDFINNWEVERFRSGVLTK